MPLTSGFLLDPRHGLSRDGDREADRDGDRDTDWRQPQRDGVLHYQPGVKALNRTREFKAPAGRGEPAASGGSAPARQDLARWQCAPRVLLAICWPGPLARSPLLVRHLSTTGPGASLTRAGFRALMGGVLRLAEDVATRVPRRLLEHSPGAWPTPTRRDRHGQLYRRNRGCREATDSAEPDEVIELLTELAECGSCLYRETEPASDALQQLMERLNGEERRLLVAYEEHSNHVAELWADDRFRLGYVLGASGLLS